VEKPSLGIVVLPVDLGAPTDVKDSRLVKRLMDQAADEERRSFDTCGNGSGVFSDTDEVGLGGVSDGLEADGESTAGPKLKGVGSRGMDATPSDTSIS